jgi:hypothetical protein
LDGHRLAPRDYVLENLGLGAKAREFVEIVQGVGFANSAASSEKL